MNDSRFRYKLSADFYTPTKETMKELIRKLDPDAYSIFDATENKEILL